MFQCRNVSMHAVFCILMAFSMLQPPAIFWPAGIKAASGSSKYVLCLDDDVMLHPTAISMLVAAVQDDPEAFMVTGEHRTAPA